MNLKESAPQNKPEFPFKVIDTIDRKTLDQIVELEHVAWRHEITSEEMAKWLQGGVVGAIYSGDKMIGDVITRTVADPTKAEEIILSKLPSESLNADGTLVHPDFRGHGLQKVLLLSRLDLARKLGKETILSCVRAENGASLRNIINTGARILAYYPNYFPDSYNTARLIWENDLIIPAGLDEKVENTDGQFPDIVVDVKSGEVVDSEAQKTIAEILSKDYVGIDVQTFEKDKIIIGVNVFHLFKLIWNRQKKNIFR